MGRNAKGYREPASLLVECGRPPSHCELATRQMNVGLTARPHAISAVSIVPEVREGRQSVLGTAGEDDLPVDDLQGCER
jgi:hypothetical protein